MPAFWSKARPNFSASCHARACVARCQRNSLNALALRTWLRGTHALVTHACDSRGLQLFQ
jgi:hypothetical protein